MKESDVIPRFHFISGLPRSGSTLLGAILRQNPAFHASMTSALGFLANSVLVTMSEAETSTLLNDAQRPSIFRGLFQGYYAHLGSGTQVVFDTNRIWCSKLPLLKSLYPDSKLIVCVRDLPWVLDSIEQLIRKAPYQYSSLFGNAQEAATVYSRVEALTQPGRLVGSAWAALKEAFYSDLSACMLIVEYEYLASKPEKVMKLIYRFLEEPWYAHHDFGNVAFDAPAFDRSVIGLEGLHSVRREVGLLPRRTILPPDIVKRFEGMSFWRGDTGASRASVIAAQPAAAGHVHKEGLPLDM